jgi:hypothetical protein
MARRTLYLPALIVAAVLMACAGALLLAVSREGRLPLLAKTAG